MTSYNTSEPFYSNFKYLENIEWQMSRAEKYCLIHLLQTIKPEYSLEIGTYKGGSLQVLSKFSKKVYSIDIDSKPKNQLSSLFKNVIFKTGKSHKLIKSVLNEIENKKGKLSFILIDGDHSKEGVKKDLEQILSFNFKHPLFIILHDSFNPQCREGMKAINYKKYKFIEHIDLDFIQGCFSPNTDYKQMWGGFGLIKINPNIKNKNIKLNQSQKLLFDGIYWDSVHLIKDKFLFLKPLKKMLKSIFN
jgi:hypothetical protein